MRHVVGKTASKPGLCHYIQMIVQAEACVRLAAMTSWLASIPGQELSGGAGDPTAMLLKLRLGPTGGGRSPPSHQARSQPWLETFISSGTSLLRSVTGSAKWRLQWQASQATLWELVTSACASTVEGLAQPSSVAALLASQVEHYTS